VLLTLSAASLLAQPSETLKSVPTNDAKVVRRWSLPGDPHGLALGNDGTIYVGLAQPQAVIAVDPKRGTVKKRVVLDSAEIASTKELVTLRTNRSGTRLYIANGSDESATILALPDLHVVREITMEGEPIRDALPDPRGRYLYVLGRRVHVYDANGETELHTIDVANPTAIAATSKSLAVFADDLTLFDTTNFTEVAHHPLPSKPIDAALFARDDATLIAFAHDAMLEIASPANVTHVCLPENSGPQIAALAPNDVLLFAERRCSSSGAFGATAGRVTPASLYGVNAYAVAYDRFANTLVTTDREGYLTIYKVPRAAVAH